jgi:hypothetical protein
MLDALLPDAAFWGGAARALPLLLIDSRRIRKKAERRRGGGLPELTDLVGDGSFRGSRVARCSWAGLLGSTINAHIVCSFRWAAPHWVKIGPWGLVGARLGVCRAALLCLPPGIGGLEWALVRAPNGALGRPTGPRRWVCPHGSRRGQAACFGNTVGQMWFEPSKSNPDKDCLRKHLLNTWRLLPPQGHTSNRRVLCRAREATEALANEPRPPVALSREGQKDC